MLPLLASTTRASHEATLRKYLIPVFGDTALRDISTLMLQTYFSGLGSSPLGGHTILKLKEALSSIMGSAMRYDLLSKNPVLAVQMPRAKVINKTRKKPHLTPEEFEQLLQLVSEPYATMIYIAVFSGLRISELIGLKWNDVHCNSLTVDERYCRGDWSKTKTSASAATVGVPDSVIVRIQRLKTLEVEINWGGKGAKEANQVSSLGRSARSRLPIHAHRRSDAGREHLTPAPAPGGAQARHRSKKATWRSLRTSCATWMVEAGANPKDVQGQMRHSRLATTLDIYAQHVPQSQERAVAKMVEMVAARRHAQFEQLKTDVVN